MTRNNNNFSTSSQQPQASSSGSSSSSQPAAVSPSPRREEEAEEGNVGYTTYRGQRRQGLFRHQREQNTTLKASQPHLEEMQLARYFMSLESPRNPWTSTQMCSAGLVVLCTSRSVKNGRLCSLQSPHTIWPLSSSCIARTFERSTRSTQGRNKLGTVVVESKKSGWHIFHNLPFMTMRHRPRVRREIG